MTRVRVVKVERNRATWRGRYCIGKVSIVSEDDLGMINKTNTCLCNDLISKSVVHLSRDYH